MTELLYCNIMWCIISLLAAQSDGRNNMVTEPEA